MTPDLVADLELALLMAQTADSITMAHFQSLDLIIDTKPDLTPVTEADRQVEQTLRALISGQRPLDSVLGEEFGVTGDSTRQWIIDPIDGTKNYVRGVPVWATLIALAVEDVVVLGVVSAPALGRRWWARLAGGLGISIWRTGYQVAGQLGAGNRRCVIVVFGFGGLGECAAATGRGHLAPARLRGFLVAYARSRRRR